MASHSCLNSGGGNDPNINYWGRGDLYREYLREEFIYGQFLEVYKSGKCWNSRGDRYMHGQFLAVESRTCWNSRGDLYILGQFLEVLSGKCWNSRGDLYILGQFLEVLSGKCWNSRGDLYILGQFLEV